MNEWMDEWMDGIFRTKFTIVIYLYLYGGRFETYWRKKVYISTYLYKYLGSLYPYILVLFVSSSSSFDDDDDIINDT